MAGKKIGYIRVSTFEQNPERQLEDISLNKKFTDKASGKNMARPQLNAMLEYVRDGDTIIVHSMDRLARNWFCRKIYSDNKSIFAGHT